MQHALYRAAKADPGRRFHALYDKIRRRDVLWRAWAAVRRNNGAPGIDKITLAQVEEYGVDRLPGELASELREGRYRPLPARRVLIPKPGTTEQRPLSIPPVRDRIVQAAVKIVLEPVFEADFLPCRPYLNILPFLADSGFEGAGAGVLVPVRNPARGDPGIDTKTRNALLRSLRYQGERGFALMKQRWRAIQYVSVSPTTIGDIAKAVLVLVQFEHKMII